VWIHREGGGWFDRPRHRLAEARPVCSRPDRELGPAELTRPTTVLSCDRSPDRMMATGPSSNGLAGRSARSAAALLRTGRLPPHRQAPTAKPRNGPRPTSPYTKPYTKPSEAGGPPHSPLHFAGGLPRLSASTCICPRRRPKPAGVASSRAGTTAPLRRSPFPHEL
jgi:hypothetical protein